MTSSRPQYALMLAAAVLLSVAGCKQASTPAASSAEQPAVTAPSEIGGAPIVQLKSDATPTGEKPQFLTATIFPGRGMNVFEITAYLPGKGVIKVLASPSLTEAAEKLNGGPGDQNGNASFSFGGAFLVPYPNRILGKLSPDGSTITTQWHGHTLTLPANWHNSAEPTKDKHAMHGLILASQTQDVQTQNTTDGQTVTGVIHAGDFGGHWLSQTDLNFTIALAGKAIDATIVAKNVGK